MQFHMVFAAFTLQILVPEVGLHGRPTGKRLVPWNPIEVIDADTSAGQTSAVHKVCNMTEMVAEFKKNKKGDKVLHIIFDNANLRFIPRSILEALKACTVLHGDVVVGAAGFAKPGSEDDNGEYVRVEHLDNLKNLRIIYGSVKLEFFHYPEIKSLDSIFENLREIHGDIFRLRQSKVEALNFSGVFMNVSRAMITDNPQLCYLDNFHTNLPDGVRLYHSGNRNTSECQREGKVCDAACADYSGCLGPGKRRCAECRAFRAGVECVESCDHLAGYYRQESSRECGKCHPECGRSCTGEGSNQCQRECKRAKDEDRCVPKCPMEKFLDQKTQQCLNCSRRCVVASLNYTGALCNGSRPDDCYHRCRENGFVEVWSGKPVCRPCNASCRGGCLGPHGKDCINCENLLRLSVQVWTDEDVTAVAVDCLRDAKKMIDDLEAANTSFNTIAFQRDCVIGFVVLFVVAAAMMIFCIDRKRHQVMKENRRLRGLQNDKSAIELEERERSPEKKSMIEDSSCL